MDLPLADVSLELYDDSYNWLARVNTDLTGQYMFLGLDNGNYRVLANGPPEGYAGEAYLDVPCDGHSCDLVAEGTPVVISDGDAHADIALDYAGTRLMGTVTRGDNGDPVSSDFGYMGVILFDEGR